MRSSRCDGTGDPAAHNNISEGMGRMVVTQTLGGLYAQFFEEVGKAVHGDGRPLVLEDRPNLERIVTIRVQYGIEIPPPIAQRSRA